MMYFTGFNGFQQFSHLLNSANDSEREIMSVSNFVKCDDISFKDLDFTWSNLLIIKDDSASLSGFLDNKCGQLISLVTPDQHKIIQGRCNARSCALVTEIGTCWLYNFDSELWTHIIFQESVDFDDGIVKDIVTKLAFGEVINAALTSAGNVWNMGSQLSSRKNMKVIEIDCGRGHGILLTDRGEVFSWGDGSRGQLGDGTLNTSEEICEVALLAGIKITRISAGGWHSAVLSQDGDVYTWGWNKQGQLGHLSPYKSVLAEPRVIDWPTNSLNVWVQQISCGSSHTVALLENGELWGCGWNKWGQLGTIDQHCTYQMTKMEFPKSISIKKIICGSWSTVVIGDEA